MNNVTFDTSLAPLVRSYNTLTPRNYISDSRREDGMLRAGVHGRGMELKRVIPVWNCGRGLMLQIMMGAYSTGIGYVFPKGKLVC